MPSTLGYTGATVPAAHRDRWRSRNHIGNKKPVTRVYVRTGKFIRSFEYWAGEQFGAVSGRAASARQWQATWTPTSDYIELPNVRECRLEQSFDSNGVGTATITVDNIFNEPHSGIAGIYHLIQRGYFSPLRGFQAAGRPDTGQDQNDWFRMLDSKVQILVQQGYGDDALANTFTGLLDSTDLEENETVTITARDFGQVVTDESFYGWVKDKHIKAPLVFVPVSGVEEEVGGGFDASSSVNGHSPSHATIHDSKAGSTGHWASSGQNTTGFTEWIQTRLPQGTYNAFTLDPVFDGHEVYVSVYARDRELGHKSRVNNTPVNEGWIAIGAGTVPGSNGGVPYIKHFDTVASGRDRYLLPELTLGPDSVLRVHFRRLHTSSSYTSPPRKLYYAAVRQLAGLRRAEAAADTEARKFIYIDDVTDLVRVTLRWAGFKEWEIEDAGVPLRERFVVNKNDKLVDVINKVKEQLGFTFFMGEPSNATTSIGVPIFRRNAVFSASDRGRVEELRDDQLLVGLKAHYTDEPLRSPIRIYGKQINGPRRHFFKYHAPWYKRMGAVLRHFSHRDERYTSRRDCQFAAYVVALQMALASWNVIFSCPGTPHLGLDTVVSVVDRVTATNGRIYISNRVSTFRGGAQATWSTELGGSFYDSPDVQAILAAWRSA